MQYYFENVFGIMQMMIMMPIAIILVDTFKKNDRTEIISKVITFIILYVALIVINFLFPQLSIVDKNRMLTCLYFIIAMVF